MFRSRHWKPILTAALILACASPMVHAQSFSITFQGPSNGIGAPPIDAASILVPTPPAPALGPLPAPTVAVPFAQLGIFPPFTWNMPELDALSYGTAMPLYDNGSGGWVLAPRFHFSVDPWAAGIPGSPAAPNVTSEGMLGNREASADVFINLPIPLAPLGPGVTFGNTAVLDGNGLAPSGVPGLGLIEPNPPTPGFPDPGDDLDAFSLFNPMWPVYFSLDAGYIDPLDGPPANLGSAPANGFSGADVVVVPAPFAVPVVWAPAAALGLRPGDDLDALILWENGDGVFTPSKKAFDWQFNNTDMLLFSVRRGSPIIGRRDSQFGIPIEEGDILMPPVGGAVNPGIFIAAEALGLITVRSGGSVTGFGDDLNALGLPPC